MNFGDREEMIELANQRLEEVKKRYPEAVLGNVDDVRVFFLFQQKPELYFKSYNFV